MSKFQAGDKVRCIGARQISKSAPRLVRGKTYVVERLGRYGCVVVEGIDWVFGNFRFEHIDTRKNAR